MSEQIIAWDIETAPQPLDQLSERQQRRHDLLLEKELKQNPDGDRDDLSRKVRSLHPMLGWICCISVVRLAEDGLRGEPKSYATDSMETEAELLATFWSDVQRFRGSLRWVTFNGKRFDVDWLKVRSAFHDLAPTRRDLLDSYPFNHRPHCDLARVFDCPAGLADLCDLLGIESPKTDLDGSGVAAAVSEGRIDEVAEYCERDVLATIACYLRLVPQLH